MLSHSSCHVTVECKGSPERARPCIFGDDDWHRPLARCCVLKERARIHPGLSTVLEATVLLYLRGLPVSTSLPSTACDSHHTPPRSGCSSVPLPWHAPSDAGGVVWCGQGVVPVGPAL